ncbi:1,4-dihydroxy-2-naphthoate polyprenyltransferase [Saccharibacillus alkalitolerans]|uniref:1,4-dihydroxy-2-naphthoate polyprenyltransferase n=1 Tax=Saccharibacillus alkalitolerans TaxID=2705290 RepID=A0ABX0F5P8_9BACL|nr:1,4-dihydroxy-2-naphthoate polyprenyltransferase [Saccharibacillus alkalitolerans]NGZ76268.1 1,4-dihydroxy-2-naphthoate polyprenyltransferase [Saccharibacillus alkalitolerans]
MLIFRSFLDLVEIRTKAASMLPFALGTVYALLRFGEFHPAHFALMLLSLLSFDLVVTAMNNYYDYRKAVRTHGYGYEEHNAIVRHGIKEWKVVLTIILLFATAVAAGILLVVRTGPLVLLLGFLSFGVGILYSFGPIPISRMPLGELFSGLFMGFVITFVSAYIQVAPDRIASLDYVGGWFDLRVNVTETLLVLLVSIPAVAGIANIMLANNVCDMNEDVENSRYTLPVYIGRSNALKLFAAIYYASYLDLFVLLWLGVHPLLILPVLATLVPLQRNIRTFTEDPSKRRTFVLAVKNFALLTGARVVVIAAAAWIVY